MKIAGRTIVITGASSGIGAACAEAFAAAGAHLALADIDAARLAEVATGLAAEGRRVSQHTLDVASRDGWARFAAEVRAAHGGAHVLVNNAGITVLGTFEDHSPEDFDRVLAVNLGGVVEGCRAFLPLLREAEAAHIVNVSSIFGVVGIPGQSAYCTSKFAVRGFTESLAEELRGSPIGVTVVHPGGVRTRIVSSAHAAGAEARERHASLSDRFARVTMSPRRAAAQILAAVAADRPRLLVGYDARALDWLRRLAPTLGNRLAAHVVTGLVGINLRQRRLKGP